MSGLGSVESLLNDVAGVCGCSATGHCKNDLPQFGCYLFVAYLLTALDSSKAKHHCNPAAKTGWKTCEVTPDLPHTPPHIGIEAINGRSERHPTFAVPNFENNRS
jgi:hypothetical protein